MSESKQKQIQIVILNQNGDDRFTKGIEEAVATVVKEFFSKGRFPFVNSKSFNFSATGETDKPAILEDVNKLRALLSQDGDVTVTLTGQLVGGV